MVAAVLVAALGGLLVFLYVQGADSRAEERFDTVDVLKATAIIEPGETIEDAQAAGKLTLAGVAQDQLLAGYQTDTSAIAGTKAMQTIYPGEQIVADKFGTGAVASSALQIPDDKIAISVNLTDPARVAGFVNPGSEVAIFVSGTLEGVTPAGEAVSGGSITRLLLPAPGHRPGSRQHHAHDHHDHRRDRCLHDGGTAADAAHARGRPARGREGAVRSRQR